MSRFNEDSICDECGKPFTEREWELRHWGTGEDEEYHAHCCPVCKPVVSPEWCPNCNKEVELRSAMTTQVCPGCGKNILPCTFCRDIHEDFKLGTPRCDWCPIEGKEYQTIVINTEQFKTLKVTYEHEKGTYENTAYFLKDYVPERLVDLAWILARPHSGYTAKGDVRILLERLEIVNAS